MRFYICAAPSGLEIKTDRSGVGIVTEEDHGVTLEGMKNGGAVSVKVNPGHNGDELLHVLRLELPGGIEAEMMPEIGNETSFVFFGHRRVDDSRGICDRAYLATDGKWKPVTEGFARSPADAMRINLVSITQALSQSS